MKPHQPKGGNGAPKNPPNRGSAGSKQYAVPVPLSTLKWWRELVDLKPQDLAPCLDAIIAKSETK